MKARFISAPVVIALLAGCAGRDPAARVGVRPGFAAMPASQRQAALNGTVRTGMSRDAVFVAWGAPTGVYHGKANGRTLETWIYLRALPSRPGPDFGNFSAGYDAARQDFVSAYYRGNRFENTPGAINSRFYPGAVFYPGPVPPNFQYPSPILEKQAVFDGDRVVKHAALVLPLH